MARTHTRTNGYAFRVIRVDTGHVLTYGVHTGPESWEAVTIADREERTARTWRNYRGPLAIAVWEHRGEEEHYRTPPPTNAERFRYPATP